MKCIIFLVSPFLGSDNYFVQFNIKAALAFRFSYWRLIFNLENQETVKWISVLTIVLILFQGVREKVHVEFTHEELYALYNQVSG